MRTPPLAQSIVAAIAWSGFTIAAHAADWLQFGYDQAHSGNNAEEKGYSTATGNKLAFASVNLAHQADSAPIYLSGVATANGTKDLLFINSLDGTLVALDAATATVVWSKQPTPAAGTNGTLAFGGITGSPAIDPAREFIYAFALDGNVHKYQVSDGTEILTNGTSTGKLDGWPEVSTKKPESEKGASAIAINTITGGANYLYSVTNGYDGDGGDYQGHITSINLTTNTQNVFNVECSDQTIHFTTQTDCSTVQNGIWGRPGAIYDPATNRVYVATANGPFNASTGGHNWGDSVLALNPDGSGSGGGMPVDSYTPSSFQGLQDTDADLGSTSPALLPAPAGSNVAHLALQGGKDGCVRLLNLGNLSGQSAAGKVGGELQAQTLPTNTNHCIDGGNSSTFKTQAAVWVNPADKSTWAFVGHNKGIVGYQVTLSAGTPALTQRWASTTRGSSPVVAGNTLYYTTDTNNNTKSIYALDPTTGNQIWTVTENGGVHWQSLIVVNSRIYLIDNGSKLSVYQLDGVFKSKFD